MHHIFHGEGPRYTISKTMGLRKAFKNSEESSNEQLSTAGLEID